jgi:hypothetical protein
MRFRRTPKGGDRWTISRHHARGTYLYWHPTQGYGWTNNRHKAARFPTYTQALRAAESTNYRDRFEIGRI